LPDGVVFIYLFIYWRNTMTNSNVFAQYAQCKISLDSLTESTNAALEQAAKELCRMIGNPQGYASSGARDSIKSQVILAMGIKSNGDAYKPSTLQSYWENIQAYAAKHLEQRTVILSKKAVEVAATRKESAAKELAQLETLVGGPVANVSAETLAKRIQEGASTLTAKNISLLAKALASKGTAEQKARAKEEVAKTAAFRKTLMEKAKKASSTCIDAACATLARGYTLAMLDSMQQDAVTLRLIMQYEGVAFKKLADKAVAKAAKA
jgi:mannose/fructose-specific phosphotransferase system component IIA